MFHTEGGQLDVPLKLFWQPALLLFTYFVIANVFVANKMMMMMNLDHHLNLSNAMRRGWGGALEFYITRRSSNSTAHALGSTPHNFVLISTRYYFLIDKSVLS